MKTILIDCTSGVSGDMLVGGLLDLGVDQKQFKRYLSSLNVPGFKVEITNIHKNGKNVCDYDVIIDERASLGNLNLSKVTQIINKSPLSKLVKDLACQIFKIAAIGGAKAHKVTMDEFYFHEKGAVDSFADIVGAAICIDLLNIEKVYITQIYDGHGYINYSKGKLAVPVPAVRNIVEKYELDLISTEIEGELVTPTGAAIIAGIRTMNKLDSDFQILKTGRGNGKRKYNHNAVLEIHELNLV